MRAPGGSPSTFDRSSVILSDVPPPELITTSELARRLGLKTSGIYHAMRRISVSATGAESGRGGEDLWDWTLIQKRWADPVYRPSVLWRRRA